MAPDDTVYAFAFSPQVPSEEETIGKREFDQIKPSREHVLAVQELEDLYDMFVKAVWQFDQLFFQHADLARFENGDDESFHRQRQEINNATVEVFSILQMFLDYQSDNPHVKRAPLPKLADEPAVKRCKALRNYLQHVGTFPLTISTGSRICAQEVDFSSVRFTMKRQFFELDRLKKHTKTDFESAFPAAETDIDLYEVVSCGFDAVSRFVAGARALPFFDDECERCSCFLAALEERTLKKGKMVLRYADGLERAGRERLMPYLAERNIRRIKDLRRRYPCRPVSNVYVTNAPESFLRNCTRTFVTREVMESIIAKQQKPPPEKTGDGFGNSSHNMVGELEGSFHDSRAKSKPDSRRQQ